MSTLVRHAMTGDLKTLGPDMSARDAAALMRSYDIGVVPVVERDGEMLGLVTDRDLVVRVVAEGADPAEVPLRNIATRATVTTTPDAGLSEARDLMARHRIRRLPVMKGEELVGIVSLGDVALATASTRAVGDTLEEISTSVSTQPDVDGPDQGTPERVKEARREQAS